MNPAYTRILLRRTIGFWIGIRLIFLLLQGWVGLMDEQASPVFTAVAGILVVMLTTGLVLFDAHKAGEDVLIANFGASHWQAALPVVALAAFLELITLALLMQII